MKKTFTSQNRPSRLTLLGSCLLFLMVAISSMGNAQTTVQVGTATNSTQYVPIYAYYGYSYSQTIYTAADIAAAGGFQGLISKIRYMRNAGTMGANDANWTIYMGHTTTNEFTSNTAWIPVTQLTQVYSGTLTFANNGAWTEIAMNTSFQWNGTDNIVVAVDENTASYSGSSTSSFTSTNNALNRAIYYYSDGTNPDPANPPGALGRVTGAPNIQFNFLTPCAGVPTPGNTIATPASVCAGQSTTLSLQNNYLGFSGITYQWQKFDGTAWVNIPTATSATYTATNLTATADYRCKVTCDGTNEGISNLVTAIVNAAPVLAISPASSIVCPSAVVAITASGADTYAWSPATGLSATTGATVNATVTAARTYSVVGTTTATGCTSTITTNVTTINQQSIVVSKTPALVCASGAPVTLTVSNNPAFTTLEYQWYDSLGAVAQAWSTTATYTFTPATDGVYKFSIKARLVSCNTNESVSQSIIFNVGFTASVTASNIFCGQTGGTIAVTNPFGPGINEVWYSNDFNTAALNGGQLFNNASITGNKLQLTANAGSLSGGFLIPNTSGINAKTLNLEFDLTVGGAQNSSSGADGLSWSFGPDVVGLPSGTGNGPTTTNIEMGSGSGLKVGFDAYGGSFPNQAGIYLMYNCTLLDVQQASPGVIQYLNNLTWKAGTKHVSITVDDAGLFTMKFGTTVIFNNVQLPAAYAAADKSTWKHAFAARTGGVSENHEIDNLVIKYGRADYGYVATGAGVPATWQAGGTFTNVPLGTYDVYIANAIDHTCNELLGIYTIGDAMTPAPGNSITSAANICANTSTAVTLSLQNNYSAYTGITYQWQMFDGTSWADIQGATAATYTFTGLPQTTDFRAEVSCDTNMTGISNLVTVSAVQPPTVAVTPTAVTLCTGETTTLTVTGADNYAWSPSGGLSASTGASVTANPTAYQQYTVTGTSTSTGCINTATVYVTPIQNLPITTSLTPASVCQSGTPVTINVTSIPDYVAGGGTLEYQFLDSTGTVLLQDWSASASYTFTPTVEGLHIFNVNMRSTACAAVPQTKEVQFYVGFGGEVSKIDINCYIPTGTININNAFGQGTGGSWYSNNFSSTTLNATQATLHQNASITGGRGVLTASATSVRGGITILNPAGIAGTNVQYDVTFKMTADQPINTYGTGGADGIAYSFGPDANYNNTTGSPCSGFGSKLRVSFDAAGNSGDNGNNSGIYISYGYGGTLQIGPSLATTLAYTPNTSLWKLKTDVPVAIKITAAGKLTLTVNDTIVFTDIQLPAEFQSTNKTTWKHLFSAHTGGDAMRQAIDDLNIRYSALNFGLAAGNSGTLPTTWQNSTTFAGLTSGDYDVYVSDENNANCNKFLGTHSIIDRNPHVDFPADTTICAGTSLVLDAGNLGSFYEWSTGDIGTDEQFLTVTTQGTYIVDVEDTIGCTTTGIISVLVSTNPVVSLGPDASFCSGSTFTLDAGTDGSSYLWSNNTTNQTLNVTASGTYSVTVTNDDNCSSSDNIVVTVLQAPSVASVGSQVNGLSVALTAQTPQNANVYTWNFGDGNSIATVSPNINYNFANCGTYNITLTVSNSANCGTDDATTSVSLICTDIEEMDANGGLNVYPNPARDFIAVANPNGLTIERLTVYDAAGKQMFMSSNVSNIVPDISTWAPGMYLVKIDADSKTFVQRIIIGK